MSSRQDESDDVAMQLSVIPGVEVELDVSIGRNAYSLIGPETVLAGMRKMAGGLLFSQGTISPLAVVTVPDEVKGTLAIPPNARFFAFMYPIKDLAPTVLPSDQTLCTFLLGGFLYFDADKQLLCFNGLALSPSSVVISLKGPFDGDLAFTDRVADAGRLADVTISQLREGGFRKFAWIHPSETFSQDDGSELRLGSNVRLPVAPASVA